MLILMFARGLIEISAFMTFYYSCYYKGSIKFFYKFCTVTLKFSVIPGSIIIKNVIEVFKKTSIILIKSLLVIFSETLEKVFQKSSKTFRVGYKKMVGTGIHVMRTITESRSSTNYVLKQWDNAATPATVPEAI